MNRNTCSSAASRLLQDHIHPGRSAAPLCRGYHTACGAGSGGDYSPPEGQDRFAFTISTSLVLSVVQNETAVLSVVLITTHSLAGIIWIWYCVFFRISSETVAISIFSMLEYGITNFNLKVYPKGQYRTISSLSL